MFVQVSLFEINYRIGLIFSFFHFRFFWLSCKFHRQRRVTTIQWLRQYISRSFHPRKNFSRLRQSCRCRYSCHSWSTQHWNHSSHILLHNIICCNSSELCGFPIAQTEKGKKWRWAPKTEWGYHIGNRRRSWSRWGRWRECWFLTQMYESLQSERVAGSYLRFVWLACGMEIGNFQVCCNFGLKSNKNSNKTI